MRLGALLTPVDDDARAIPEQARAIESAGFSSVWSAHAIGRGFMLMDPLIATAAAAVATEHVEIGTAVLQLPLYNPTDVALKSWAVAQLSGGRFRLGVGAGSSRPDFDAHGMPYAERFRRFDACVAELQAIFARRGVNDVPLSPPAAVAEGPPLLLGSWTKSAARAATEFDGWMASGMYTPVDDAVEALQAYRAAGGARALVTTLLVGADTDLGELRERLARYAEAGFDDAIVMPLPGGPDLEAIRALA